MSVRRRTVLAAAAAAVAVTAVSPGLIAATSPPTDTAGEEPVTISFLTHWPPETVELLEEAASVYSEANPNVTVEIQAVPFGDLLTTIRAQAGGDAPTISGIYDLWLPELVRDELVVAAPEAVATEVTDNWPAGVVTAATVDDALYGVPNEIDLYALNYNTALFEEAGIEAAPATWDELIAAAEALTVRDGDTITRQGLGLINSWAAGVVHPFASLLASNGGTLIGEDGMPALNTPEALETFELYENLVSGVQVTDPTMGTADANTTGPFLDNFVAGNTAMIIMANWWESALRTGMGDEEFANIATAPIPVGPSGESAVEHLLLVDDRRQLRRRGGRAGRRLGLPRLAQRPRLDARRRPRRLVGDGQHLDVDGHPADAHLGHRGVLRPPVDAVPRGLRQPAGIGHAVPDRARRAGVHRGAAGPDRGAGVRRDRRRRRQRDGAVRRRGDPHRRRRELTGRILAGRILPPR